MINHGVMIAYNYREVTTMTETMAANWAENYEIILICFAWALIMGRAMWCAYNGRA